MKHMPWNVLRVVPSYCAVTLSCHGDENDGFVGHARENKIEEKGRTST
jgi:hypothetical protein